MVEELTPKETRVTRGTKAEGEVSFQSSENAYTAPKITPETARNYFEQNIPPRYADRQPPPAGLPGGAGHLRRRTATWSVSTTSRDWIARTAESVGVYPSMKASWIDTIEPRLQRQKRRVCLPERAIRDRRDPGSTSDHVPTAPADPRHVPGPPQPADAGGSSGT